MITDKQRRTLSMILFLTGIVCLLFYLPVILHVTVVDYTFEFVEYIFDDIGLTPFLTIILPAFLVFFGYGVQLTLVYLNPNKRRFIFSIISYSFNILLFIDFIVINIVFPDAVEFFAILGVSGWSFIYILFFLIIAFNIALHIFLTHVKVKEDEKEKVIRYKDLLNSKLKKAHFIIFVILAAVLFLHVQALHEILTLEEFFKKAFPGSETFKDKPTKIRYFYHSFIVALDILLIVGLALQASSIVDPKKQKEGFIGIILEIIYFGFSVIHYPAVLLIAGVRIYGLGRFITIWIFTALVSLLFITNFVLYFLRKKKDKEETMKEIITAEEAIEKTQA